MKPNVEETKLKTLTPLIIFFKSIGNRIYPKTIPNMKKHRDIIANLRKLNPVFAIFLQFRDTKTKLSH